MYPPSEIPSYTAAFQLSANPFPGKLPHQNSARTYTEFTQKTLQSYGSTAVISSINHLHQIFVYVRDRHTSRESYTFHILFSYTFHFAENPFPSMLTHQSSARMSKPPRKVENLRKYCHHVLGKPHTRTIRHQRDTTKQTLQKDTPRRNYQKDITKKTKTCLENSLKTS